MNRRDGDIANDFIGSSVSLARVADMGGARDCGNWQQQQQQQQQQARGGYGWCERRQERSTLLLFSTLISLQQSYSRASKLSSFSWQWFDSLGVLLWFKEEGRCAGATCVQVL